MAATLARCRLSPTRASVVVTPHRPFAQCKQCGTAGHGTTFTVGLLLAHSAYPDEAYVRGMLEADAVGYLLKSEAPEVIVAAVRAAARGEGHFSPAVAAQMAAWVRGRAPEKAGLTERELEVLRLLARGWDN